MASSSSPSSSSLTRVTHYTILGLPQDSTLSTIRNAYTALVLKLHPDKANTATEIETMISSASSNSSFSTEKDTTTEDKFIQVQLAWEVLRDTVLRKQYDDELRQVLMDQQQQQYDRPVSDEIEFEDLTKTPSTPDIIDSFSTPFSIVKYTYPCRCGDLFTITDHDITNRITLFDCNTCSLRIRIVYNV